MAASRRKSCRSRIPLATLTGTSNMLILSTDTMGDLAIGEYDGGTTQTAYGVLADILQIAGSGQQAAGSRQPAAGSERG